MYTLIGADGRPYLSRIPGRLGGHRRGRLYGRLDCPSALRAIARGGYAGQRVFFADEATALAAGYRPCAVCLPARYRAFMESRDEAAADRRGAAGSAHGGRTGRAP
ncbi:Ada metal-binding domain-containing protein [Spongiactinospora sp. 9N601]|uniref:Ada metal-binding domain-containing protein n=1 Tax=Spongiactinospora sp. 9N601 TaxID=3375149 RepID=UPI0037B89DF3